MSSDRRILGLKPETLFQGFKYSIYTLIFINFVYFLHEEYLALAARFPEGIGLGHAFDAFSQSTDSFGWLILLLIFELQTYVVSDEKLKGALKWSLNLAAGICYVLIIQALIGYVNHMEVILDFQPYAGAACDAVGVVSSVALDLYEFPDLSAENCGMFAQGATFYNEHLNALTTAELLPYLENLAITDVVNAATWVLIVIVLWIDIFLQLRRELTEKLYKWNGVVKALLYITLIVCCSYWAWLGDFMGFWDAFLWIVAFFFIEMNLFKWHEAVPADEDEEEQARDTAVERAEIETRQGKR
ncbi:hypothetical protein [Kordiimonas aestuarii]|uniref:hypothetical protein n=1 Tax=Kordiimonas aestuarii TaxID=1005925 RepID=UPI0021D0CAF4|nr:hypothetical protein [Kordiimonas aestuarii]